MGNDWNAEWERDFELYHTDLRFTYILRSILRKSEKRILEIAGGSFRDTLNISRLTDVNCIGIDSCEKCVELAQKKFPLQRDKLKVMNAFNLQFPDKYFDMSFHNGFWGFFQDSEIRQLIKEQVRVSRDRIIAVCHNMENVKNSKSLNELSTLMTSLRPFSKEELLSLMSPYCKNIVVIPIMDRGYKYLYDFHLRNTYIVRLYLKLAKYFNHSSAERLLCIGELK